MYNLYKIAPQIVNGFYHLSNPKQCSYYLATNYSIIAQNSFKLLLIGCNLIKNNTAKILQNINIVMF